MKMGFHTACIAVVAILLTTSACSKNGSADGFKGRIYHACNLDIPIEKDGVLFAFGQEDNTIYTLALGKSLKLDVPEWCISPTQEAITRHCPDVRAMLTLSVDEEAAEQNQLSFPVGKAEQFLKTLTSDKVLVVKQAKRSFVIRPGHIYRFFGAIRSRSVHRSDGSDYQVVHVDVNRLEYVSDPSVQCQP
jgi:hypothetical protein